jgi:hypothetical protein
MHPLWTRSCHNAWENLLPCYSLESFGYIRLRVISYELRAVLVFSHGVNPSGGLPSPKLLVLNPPTQRVSSPDAAAHRATPRSFFQAAGDLFQHPLRILLLWNWKSAWLSVILRGPIFLAASIRRGFLTAFSAVLTECIFCMATAGFYGALIQNLRDAEPEWLTLLFLTVLVPAFFQFLEYFLHRFRGTPHLRIAEIVSVIIGGISAFFNWYAMRRGALLVGGEGRTFGNDLRRLPRLILSFLIVLPRSLAERRRGSTHSPDSMPGRKGS